MTGFLSWLALGAVAGYVARAIIRVEVPGGCFTLPIVGMAGALFGGFVATLLGFGAISGFDFRSAILATSGSLALLFLFGSLNRKVTRSKRRSRRASAPEEKRGAERSRPEAPVLSAAEGRPKAQVFISYRRRDSADVAGRVFDRLAAHFGRERVFKDVDSIPYGVDFRRHLDRRVAECDVMVAIVGREWLAPRNPGEDRPIDDPQDFVRIEIEAALQRDIPVIPALVQGSELPGERDLPPSLRDLVYRHAVRIRTDPDFHTDVDRLIQGIEYICAS